MVFEPVMRLRSHLRHTLALTALPVFAALCQQAYAAEHITLRSGSEFDCLRHEQTGDRVRLYLIPTAHANSSVQTVPEESDYIEVPASSIVRVESIPDPPAPPAPAAPSTAAPTAATTPAPATPAATPPLTPAAMHQMLNHAGAVHNIDADLLASIVHAESNGNPHAVSRAGAQGLMQLMPSTASQLGVSNSFVPEQNIGGGTAYLDQLLTRYHDDIRLAVAAYNAGPAAVDRYHGIPPFAETRAYVARVVREFNRRKQEAIAAAHSAATATHPAPSAKMLASK
jgi:soluble lytic murein transglycosylase-like protein